MWLVAGPAFGWLADGAGGIDGAEVGRAVGGGVGGAPVAVGWLGAGVAVAVGSPGVGVGVGVGGWAGVGVSVVIAVGGVTVGDSVGGACVGVSVPVGGVVAVGGGVGGSVGGWSDGDADGNGCSGSTGGAAWLIRLPVSGTKSLPASVPCAWVARGARNRPTVSAAVRPAVSTARRRERCETESGRLRCTIRPTPVTYDRERTQVMVEAPGGDCRRYQGASSLIPACMTASPVR